MTRSAAFLAILCLLVSGMSAPCAFAAGNPGTASLTVKVTGFQSDRGSAVIALWKGSGEGFPVKRTEAMRVVRSPVRDGSAVNVFDGLVSGTYAVSVYHDENGNGTMDRNLLGMPVEARGTSRNPRPMMRPPRFTEASFDLRSGDAMVEVTLTGG